MKEILTRFPINAPHIIESDDLFTFSPSDYSIFKFGRTDIAEQFSKELLHYFLNHFRRKFHSKDLIIFPSPYSSIPTASYYIANFFFEHLKKNIGNHDYSSCRFGKVARCHTYTIDYGSLTFSERFDLIKEGTYRFETLPDSKCLLVFIDDISITGAHQLVLEQLLEDYKIENEVVFLYYAKLFNNQIPPEIENTLNYFKIKSIDDLIVLCHHPAFKLTTRFVKFILSITNIELTVFIAELKRHELRSLLKDIADAAESNSYHLISNYQENYNILCELD